MENPPFEDVFPIQDGDFPLLCLFTGGYIIIFILNIWMWMAGCLKQARRCRESFLNQITRVHGSYGVRCFCFISFACSS